MGCCKRRVCGAIIFASALFALWNPSLAQAQVPTDAIYADAKQIIEELLTTEVSQTAAPHLACLSGRRKPEAGSRTAIDITTDLKGGVTPRDGDVYVELEAVKYSPRLLQAIYDKQFASIRSVAIS